MAARRRAAPATQPGRFRGPHHPFPIRSCSVWGLPSRPVTRTLVRSFRTFPPLPVCTGGFRFYGTFPEVALAGRYPAHRPVEPGLSSEGAYVLQRLPFMLAEKIITISQGTVKAYTISKKSRALSSATISAFSPNSSTSRAVRISTTGCSVAKCPASITWMPRAAARWASW